MKIRELIKKHELKIASGAVISIIIGVTVITFPSEEKIRIKHEKKNCLQSKVDFLKYENTVATAILIDKKEYNIRKEFLKSVYLNVAKDCYNQNYNNEKLIFSKYYPRVLR